MARKQGGETKAPMKFEAVPVRPVPAAPEEVEQHLRAFVAAFICRDRRDRWLHALVEKPGKATDLLHRFAFDCDDRYFLRLHGAEAFPQALTALYGQERGVYFGGMEPPCRMTAAEAATVASAGTDLLLSFEPGRRALFFDHDGSAWRCDRPAGE